MLLCCSQVRSQLLWRDDLHFLLLFGWKFAPGGRVAGDQPFLNRLIQALPQHGVKPADCLVTEAQVLHAIVPLNPAGLSCLVVKLLEVQCGQIFKLYRGHKRDVYEKAGVREYWIVEPESKAIEVYLLKNGKFALDNVYSVYPDYLLEKMTEEEKQAVPAAFHCSLYNDLLVSIEEVFSDTF